MSRSALGPATAGDQTRPPWRSMTRRAIGSAEPEAAALVVERRRGRARMTRCTIRLRGDDHDDATVAVRALRAAGPRRRCVDAGCSRRTARKIAANAAAKPRCDRRSSARRRLRRERPAGPRDPPPRAHRRPLRRRAANRSNGSVVDGGRARVELAQTSLSSAISATSRAHDFSASSIILRCRSLSGDRRRAAASAGSRRRPSRRPELVDGQRQQLRVRLVQARPSSRSDIDGA